MGAAVYYSIHLAEGDEARARGYLATAWWLLVLASAVLTVGTYAAAGPIMRLFGAQGAIHAYGTEYLRVIALGAVLQILGVGLVPCLRNYGGAVWAMVAMVAGFVTNIALDWLFVWVYDWGMTGAALATDIGQGATVLTVVVYALRKGRFYLRLPRGAVGETCRGIVRIGLAPFGLTLTPNLSLVLVNRFSAAYGGEPAIAAYACIAYIICIIYLVLQGVGDGCPTRSAAAGRWRTASPSCWRSSGARPCSSGGTWSGRCSGPPRRWGPTSRRSCRSSWSRSRSSPSRASRRRASTRRRRASCPTS